MAMNAVGPDDLLGSVVDGRYTILERIATGGMASVYRAVDTRLDRDVAVKVMRPHLRHDEAFVSRFRREARAAARLSHPNIVSVFDQGEDQGRVFLVMEYVPGRTLRQVLEEEGSLTPRAALDIMDQVLSALGEAHAGGIVHRDVKPENVIIRDDGIVKVADFGLARATTAETATSATTEVLGTLAYVAPEQVELGQVTPRSDNYAAGLILSELLTGAKVFDGQSIPNVLWQHLHAEVPAPSARVAGLPSSLDALVLSATAKDPQQRPGDALEFREKLRRVRRELDSDTLDRRAEAPGPAGTPGTATPGTASPGTASPENAPAGRGTPDPDLPAGATTQVLHAASSPDAPTQALGGRYPTSAQAAGAMSTRAQAAGAQSATTQPSNEQSPNAQARTLSPATPSQRPAVHTGPGGGASRANVIPGHGDSDDAPRRSRRGLLVAILALLLAAGGATWYFLSGPGSPTTVPALAGLSAAEARAALDRAHLDSKDTEAFSEDVPRGQIISATPGEGSQLRRGADVTLVVSKGQERYAVPEVVGVTRKTATARLAKANLEAGQLTEEFSETVERGRVLRADPQPGAQVKRGTQVTLVVSAGPQPFDVPDFHGMPFDEAQALATEKGLELTRTEDIFSDDYAEGEVADQSPTTGQVTRGDSVSVAVSKGPDLVEVPSCFNHTEAESLALLKAAGFEVKVDRFLGGPLDRCTGQDPAGGAKAPRGSLITITIV